MTHNALHYLISEVVWLHLFPQENIIKAAPETVLVFVRKCTQWLNTYTWTEECESVSIYSIICAHWTYWDCWSLIKFVSPQNFFLSAESAHFNWCAPLITSPCAPHMLLLSILCLMRSSLRWDTNLHMAVTGWSPAEVYICYQATHKLKWWYSFAVWGDMGHIFSATQWSL